MSGQLALTLPRDAWVVMEAVGDKPMFPVITGTEEPFLLVSDAVGALAGPLGIAATTDISAVVVGNPAPYALTNPVWIRTGDNVKWQPPASCPGARSTRRPKIRRSACCAPTTTSPPKNIQRANELAARSAQAHRFELLFAEAEEVPGLVHQRHAHFCSTSSGP